MMGQDCKRTAALFYLYGQYNAGDAAIGLGALEFLTTLGYKINAVSRWPESSRDFIADRAYYNSKFGDVAISPGPFRFKRVRGFFAAVRQYSVALFSLAGVSESANVRSVILSSDLVVLNGGNLLRCESLRDFIRLTAFVYPVLLAKFYRKPYIIFPQSTSRINYFGKKLLGCVFEDARAIWVREKSSLEVFTQHFPKVVFRYAPDMAFNIEPISEGPLLLSEPGGRKSGAVVKVAVTLRDFGIGDIGPLPPIVRRRIVSTIGDVLRQLSGSEFLDLTLVVQCDVDRAVTNEVFGTVQELLSLGNFRVTILDARDTYELLEFYKSQDLLLGMRLHSIVLALSVGTPCVGYFDHGWGLKNPGLLKAFDLPCFFVANDPSAIVDAAKAILQNVGIYRASILEMVGRERVAFREECAGLLYCNRNGVPL